CLLPHLAADLLRTTHRRIGAGKENKRHSIPRRYRHQLAGSVCRAELLGVADDLVEEAEQLPLLVTKQLGVTDDVYEQHMPDLQTRIGAELNRHASCHH